MSAAQVAVLGAGGHAKVVIATLLDAGFTITAVLDEDAARWGSRILGQAVSGPFSELARLPADGAVIAVGDNLARQRIAAAHPAVGWLSVVHPSAYVHPSVSLGSGTVVFAGARVQPDCRVGRHCIVNTGATVDHDGRLGDFVHVGPGSHLSGGVRLGEGVLAGVGSAMVPGVVVGDWTVIGAGAVVVRDLPAGIVAVGSPARPRPAGQGGS